MARGRRAYPMQTRTSTAAVGDLIRKLTRGPWGDPALEHDPEVKVLLDELGWALVRTKSAREHAQAIF